jgi:hypothetical protein
MGDAWVVLGRLLLGALLGVVGQLIRVVVGLKKESDQAAAANTTLKARFDAQQVLVSLAISVAVGAIAGILSAVVTTDITTPKAMLALIGTGYSGTDAIEGFMKKG